MIGLSYHISQQKTNYTKKSFCFLLLAENSASNIIQLCVSEDSYPTWPPVVSNFILVLEVQPVVSPQSLSKSPVNDFCEETHKCITVYILLSQPLDSDVVMLYC